MKKMLILNGSHSDIRLIEEAKYMGYYTITLGNRPELIGHRYADEYISVDFSDKDAVYQIAKVQKVDAICACANDFGALSAAYAAEKLGLKGHDKYETALILHHKDKFKAFAKKNKIKTPLADSFDNVYDALLKKNEYEYPVIVKPIDLTGGKGVTRVNNPNEYELAISRAFDLSKAKKIIVESFIEGTYHSFSTFLVNKKVRAYFSDNEYSYLNPFLVTTSAHPATGINYVEKILIQEAEKIAQLLNLVDGVFHMQYIMKEKKPYIIEITRRCSGDWYCEPVEHALNHNWAKWIVMSEAGLDCSKIPQSVPLKNVFCGRHCIMGDKNGKVKDIYFSPEIQKNIYKSFLWWKPDYEITNYMVDKLGILFLEYETEDEMLDKSNRITDLIKVIYT